jgi:hypothetical protein
MYFTPSGMSIIYFSGMAMKSNNKKEVPSR